METMMLWDPKSPISYNTDNTGYCTYAVEVELLPRFLRQANTMWSNSRLPTQKQVLYTMNYCINIDKNAQKSEK